ncbi:MAG: type II secretion system protein [Candidatus Falkowbacteria bacterium]
MRNTKAAKNLAFTLIELSVVVFIIAILTSIAAWGVNSISKRTRDVRRLADVKDIQVALMVYKQQNSYFPPASQVISGQPLVSPDGRQTYMSKVPNSPACSGCGPVAKYIYHNISPNTYNIDFFLEGGFNNLKAGVYSVTQKSTPLICIPNCANRDWGIDDGCYGFCPPPNQASIFLTYWTKTSAGGTIRVTPAPGSNYLVIARETDYVMNVTGVSVTPSIGATYYIYSSGCPFTVKSTAVNNGSGIITLRKDPAYDYNCGVPKTSGNLTRLTGTGDSSIAFTHSPSNNITCNNTWFQGQNIDVPVDGQTYTPSSVYGEGSKIGESYVLAVANSTADFPFGATYLNRDTCYSFLVYKYYSQAGKNNHYLTTTTSLRPQKTSP